MSYMKKFHLAFAVNLFLCLTAFFFSSMEVYLGNISEFCFPAKHVWRIMLLVAFLLAVFLTAAESFLSGKWLFGILILSEAAALCFYLQSVFFNNHLQEMTGDSITFSKSLVSLNAVIWVIIIVLFCLAFFLIFKKAGKSKICEILILFSAALIVIQLSGLLSTAFSLSESETDKNTYLSREGEFSLSADKNVLFFILDTCDLEYVNEALEADPGLFDEFTGFVWYPDATSMYSRTYPALPYFLTGEKCYFDVPVADYLGEAYRTSSYLPTMKKAGTDIRLYTSLEYLYRTAYNTVGNIAEYDSESLSSLSVPELIKAMLHLAGYREMPYLLKPFFSYSLDPINRNVLSDPPDGYYTFSSDDFTFYARLKKTNLEINEAYSSAFRLYHLFGPHPGCYTSANAKYDPNATQTDSFRGDIFILSEYLRQLKTLGIYDKTTIIVTADHGNQNENEDLKLHNPPCCIMLLKRAGADASEPMAISDAHVSHEDLFATVLEELGQSSTNYSEPLYEHENDNDRIRTYYYTAQRSWGDGEVALKEYKITGDARDFSNWELTDNTWDILYSQNAISLDKEK